MLLRRPWIESLIGNIVVEGRDFVCYYDFRNGLWNCSSFCVSLYRLSIFMCFLQQLNPAGTPGYRNGTESFFGLKWRPSVVRDV